MKNHGCHPFGNAKARAVVWNFPDPIPQHREPLYGTRADLVAKYPAPTMTRRPSGVCPPLYKTVQDKNIADKVHEKFPLIMTIGSFGRVRRRRRRNTFEPMAGRVAAGNVRRDQPSRQLLTAASEMASALWVNIANAVRRIKVQGAWSPSAWRPTPCSCLSTSRVAGKVPTCCALLPERRSTRLCAAKPSNTATTYGYDSVTMMQETKTTVCQMWRRRKAFAHTGVNTMAQNEIHL